MAEHEMYTGKIVNVNLCLTVAQVPGFDIDRTSSPCGLLPDLQGQPQHAGTLPSESSPTPGTPTTPPTTPPTSPTTS